jgi:hypothetical protein
MLESSIKGLEPVADIEVPADVRGKVRGRPLFVYREEARGSQPVFDVVTKDLFPMVDTIADRADILTVLYDGGEEITRAVYLIRNNGRQFLRMAMPPGYEMLSVSVDNLDRKVSTRDGLLLVPLADSIQTLGGLVPFPVEIIYCRQSEKPRPTKKAKIDLPELPDVPVASVMARVFCPDRLNVLSCRSLLKQADEGVFNHGVSVLTGLTAGRLRQGGYVEDALLYNTYWSGYRAYRENRLEDAETLLSRAAGSGARDRDISAISEDLLRNIRAGRGDVEGRDKLEKAKISAIKGALSSMNEQIEAQQSELIKAGLANLDQGDQEVGAELLKEADKLGQQIGNRGGSTLRQTAVRRQYADKLKEVEDERRRKRELAAKLEQLQKEAKDLAAKAPGQARKLGKGLVQAASQENIAPEEAQLADIAWGRAEEADQVSAGAEAQALKQQVTASPGKAPSFTLKKEGKGLKDVNRELDMKVSLLEKALTYAKSVVSDEASWGQDDSGYVEKALAKKREELSSLRDSLEQGRSRKLAANDYFDSRQKLNEIKEQVVASKSSFQGIADDVSRDIVSLEGEIQQLENTIAVQVEALKADETVVLTVTNALGGASLNTLQSFNDYLNANYATQDSQRLVLQGSQIQVANDSAQVERMSEVLAKFGDNSGNAARFGGRKVAVDPAQTPAVQVWFTNTTANGTAWAILDEAQYNTLLFAEAAAPGGPAGRQFDSRDIIVGTQNGVIGKDITLVRADAEGNGIRVDGSDVELAHDKYYAIAEGDEITVIKGGAARNWQDEAQGLSLDVQAPYRIEVPESGQKMFFEKTLLSAGESPDIEIQFGS